MERALRDGVIGFVARQCATRNKKWSYSATSGDAKRLAKFSVKTARVYCVPGSLATA